MMNNRSAITMSETATLLSHISDPVFSKQLENFAAKGDIRIVLLDLSQKRDIKLHEQLYNSGDFSVMSESEHSGRYSVFVVVRYRKTGDAELGPSSAELFSEERAKEGSKKKKTKGPKKGKKAPAKEPKGKKEPPVVGFAPR